MEPGRQFHPPVTDVMVQAIYDEESIAFLVRWNDMRADTTGTAGPTLPVPIEEEEAKVAATPAAAAAAAAADPFAETTTAEAPPSEFNDAVAIQIPSSIPTGARKPYFIFGDAQSPVDLWFFDLAGKDPLQFTGRGSADLAANDTGDLTGVTSYDQGEWSVIFKRPLRPSAGAAFVPGTFLPVAFSVMNRSASHFLRPANDDVNPRGSAGLVTVYVERSLRAAWRPGIGAGLESDQSV